MNATERLIRLIKDTTQNRLTAERDALAKTVEHQAQVKLSTQPAAIRTAFRMHRNALSLLAQAEREIKAAGFAPPSRHQQCEPDDDETRKADRFITRISEDVAKARVERERRTNEAFSALGVLHHKALAAVLGKDAKQTQPIVEQFRKDAEGITL